MKLLIISTAIVAVLAVCGLWAVLWFPLHRVVICNQSSSMISNVEITANSQPLIVRNELRRGSCARHWSYIDHEGSLDIAFNHDGNSKRISRFYITRGLGGKYLVKVIDRKLK